MKNHLNFKVLEQPKQHLCDFFQFGHQRLNLFYQSNLLTHYKQALRFSTRAKSDANKASKVWVRASTMSLRNIGGDRNNRSSHLALDAKAFSFWQPISHLVDQSRNFNRSLPNLQFSKRISTHISHLTEWGAIQGNIRLQTSNLRLPTRN